MKKSAEKPKCPHCGITAKLGRKKKMYPFKDENFECDIELYVCPQCSEEIMTVEQAGKIQRKLADLYRKKHGLLTAGEIKALRKKLGLSQSKLAEKLNVGIASVKRWETGVVQTKHMNQALRSFFNTEKSKEFSGGRTFSLERTKLVLKKLSELLGCSLLRDSNQDKLLFSAKYLWFADMIAFRELGKSMTGGTYAALPYGPQLNNYKELVEDIKRSDDSQAEPLTEEEVEILKRIIKKFPDEKAVYDAAHLEHVWKTKAIGELIPYSEAQNIEAI